MYLQSVVLQGFKTFAGRTTLDLRPGITAIVGPNGSGKSNITDAVRWALGESNLRHVRCRSTDELIFAGNARRSSLGVAEVSLVFVNDGQWLDLPYSEVRVTRRAYRSGENEYLLNGVRVRLREIVDLLAGASIHAGGHVVVGQGLVDAVLSLRSEERRPVIENLAGLKQFYLRRDEAESRLEQTEANLVHVDALVAELAPQLESLARQAEALRDYRTAEGELRRLQQVSFGAQAARLAMRLQLARQRDDDATAHRDAAQRRVRQLSAEGDALAAGLKDDRAARDALQERLKSQMALAAASQRDREVACVQLKAAEERLDLATAEQRRLASAAERERSSLARAAQARAEAHADRAEVEARLAAGRAAQAGLARERDRVAAEERRAQARSDEASRIASQLAGSVAMLTASLESGAGELERQQAQLAAAAAALDEVERDLAAAKSSLAACEKARSAAAESEEVERRRVEAVSRAASAAEAALREVSRESDQLNTRCTVLQSWLDGLERFEEPVRKLANHGAVSGIVSQAIDVDPEWQVSMATFLSGRADSLLSDRPADLIAETAGGGGRLRILSLAGSAHGWGVASLNGAEKPVQALRGLLAGSSVDARQVLGWASDVCHDAAGLPACSLLELDRVLLLADLDALIRCCPMLPALRLGAVVLDRAIAALPDGSIVCGLEEAASEVIARRRDIVVLREALAELSEREATAGATLDRERERLEAAQRDHASSRVALDAATQAVARAREESRVQERLLDQARRAVVGAETPARRLVQDLGDKRKRLEAEQARESTVRGEAEAARQALARSRSDHEKARERLSAAGAACRDDEQAASRLRERATAAERLLVEQQARVAGIDGDLARCAQAAQEAAARIASLRASAEAAATTEQETSLALRSLERDLQPLEERLSDEESRFTAQRAAYHEAAQQLTQAQVVCDTAHADLESVTRDLEVLRVQVSAELRCGVEELPDEPVPHGAVSRIKALRALLAGMGPVNARAEEDYAGAGERLSFLRTQSADLHEGVARLRGIIEDTNETVRGRFRSTVEELDRQFCTFFERLFGGGTCRLVAQYDERGLPAGLEVSVQPPGKRARDLALLSGGERALVAMALLFAMLKVRPVPFCLLDEVEAALDEANTGRFGAILREMSADTQFILVTHNRGTMMHADRLYGVTMSETGISTLASLEMQAMSG